MSGEMLLGYPVNAESAQLLGRRVADWVAHGERQRWFACLNPHSVEVAERDADFKTALLTADFLVPDGVGVVFASRQLGGSIRTRVTGHDVFASVMSELARTGGRVFFLGSSAGVLAQIGERFARDFPSLTLAGTYSPPYKPAFSDADNAAMIDAINAARPDVLWVGMTAPKQEKWLAANVGQLDVAFAGAIGAVFDFYAGTVKRSSPVFQRLGLEWLPRLLQEPRRLWYRNFVSNPRFVWRVLTARWRGERARPLPG